MTTGRINQVTTVLRPKQTANRRGRQGSSPRCDQKSPQGHSSETGSSRPCPSKTSFKTPKTDAHEAVARRLPSVAGPTTERAIWDEGPKSQHPTASQSYSADFWPWAIHPPAFPQGRTPRRTSVRPGITRQPTTDQKQ